MHCLGNMFQPLQTKIDGVAPLIAYPSDATLPLSTVDCNLFIYQARESSLVPAGFLTDQFLQFLAAP